MLNVDHADVYTDFNGLAKLKTEARNESPEALKEVAKQFESIFLNMVLKNMRDAKLADGIMDSNQSEFFQDMYDQQLAVHLSGDPGVGLAELIVRQLSPDTADAGQLPTALPDYRSKPIQISQAKVSQAGFDPETAKTELSQESVGTGNVSELGVSGRKKAGKTNSELKPETNVPINSTEQFVNQLWGYAEQAARELGVDAKVLLAQAALETGWGKAVINNVDGSNSHNLFNIKADKSWHGKEANVSTLEFDHGIAKKQKAAFRSYPSYQESFRDYVNFLQHNPRYSQALKQAGSPEKYMVELQKAGYATDPDYAEKVMSIYHGAKLLGQTEKQLLAMKSL